jgi:3-hexulose-6-phosphate synthase
MKLQLALDMTNINEALKVLENVEEYVDIIEIGTPLIIKCGVAAVSRIKEIYPNKKLIADIKIADAGDYEAAIVIEAGADIITVLSVANDETINKAVEYSRNKNKEVMIDLICEKDIKKGLQQLIKYEDVYFCIHTASDIQESNKHYADKLSIVKETIPSCRLAIAGGINSENISFYTKEEPGIIIVGSGITKSNNPKESAKKIKNAIEGELK